LQDAALEGGDDAVAAWIERQQLQDVPRLLDAIEVDAGWERRSRRCSTDALGALCVQTSTPRPARSMRSADVARRLPPARPDQNDATACWRGCAVPGRWPVCCRHRVAETRRGGLHGAASSRPASASSPAMASSSVATGCAAPPMVRAVAGSIGRAEELRALQAAGEELEQVIADLSRAAGCTGRAAPRTGAGARGRLAARRSAESRARHAGCRARCRASRLEHLQERRDTLERGARELAEGRAEALEEIEAARERLHEALEQTEALTARRDDLSAERDALRNRCDRRSRRAEPAARRASAPDGGYRDPACVRDAVESALARAASSSAASA
jgi:chromosome segregation protein